MHTASESSKGITDINVDLLQEAENGTQQLEEKQDKVGIVLYISFDNFLLASLN